MRLPETRDLFVREFSFPVTCETVEERIGDRELDAPNGESETIGAVLGHCQEEEFRSADELYDALLTFVGDAYIGRKYYDDRGAQPGEEGEGVSF